MCCPGDRSKLGDTILNTTMTTAGDLIMSCLRWTRLITQLQPGTSNTRAGRCVQILLDFRHVEHVVRPDTELFQINRDILDWTERTLDMVQQHSRTPCTIPTPVDHQHEDLAALIIQLLDQQCFVTVMLNLLQCIISILQDILMDALVLPLSNLTSFAVTM